VDGIHPIYSDEALLSHPLQKQRVVRLTALVGQVWWRSCRAWKRRFTLGFDIKPVLSPRSPPTAHAFRWARNQRGNPILWPI